jgi:hypothetical protein
MSCRSGSGGRSICEEVRVREPRKMTDVKGIGVNGGEGIGTGIGIKMGWS